MTPVASRHVRKPLAPAGPRVVHCDFRSWTSKTQPGRARSASAWSRKCASSIGSLCYAPAWNLDVGVQAVSDYRLAPDRPTIVSFRVSGQHAMAGGGGALETDRREIWCDCDVCGWAVAPGAAWCCRDLSFGSRFAAGRVGGNGRGRLRGRRYASLRCCGGGRGCRGSRRRNQRHWHVERLHGLGIVAQLQE